MTILTLDKDNSPVVMACENVHNSVSFQYADASASVVVYPSVADLNQMIAALGVMRQTMLRDGK